MNYFGYPCMNRKKGWSAGKTMKLKNVSRSKMEEKIGINLEELRKMLEYNVKNRMMFFRIGSGVIPFASHKILREIGFDWKKQYKEELREIGEYIKKNKIRISMHPDHHVVLNSLQERVVENSIKDLEYHCDLLDLMGLNKTHKIQVHTGGLYNDKNNAIKNWIKVYKTLDKKVKDRLVLENDDHLYNINDVYYISKHTGVPILFDTYHHECLPGDNNETQAEAFALVLKTWTVQDGIPLIDYSSRSLEPNARKGKHAETIDIDHMISIMKQLDINKFPYDVMLEIKDKENSAHILSKYYSTINPYCYSLRSSIIHYLTRKTIPFICISPHIIQITSPSLCILFDSPSSVSDISFTSSFPFDISLIRLSSSHNLSSFLHDSFSLISSSSFPLFCASDNIIYKDHISLFSVSHFY